MQIKRFLALSALFLVGFNLITPSFAQQPLNSRDQKSDFEFVASVNGAPITRGLLELNLRSLVSQGQSDTPELRQVIKEDLINKELIAQQASKQGLAKEIDLSDQLSQLRLNLLLQAFVDEHFKKNPITSAQLRAEYDEQIKLIGNDGNGFQYRISQIVQETELEASNLIGRIQKGESFSKLAQEYSVDKSSRSQGGSLGWVLPAQVIPAIAKVLPRMNKGSITTSPIKIPAGWAIIKLDEKRPFKIANFEEAKPQLKNAIAQKYLNDTINSLRSNARIIQ